MSDTKVELKVAGKEYSVYGKLESADDIQRKCHMCGEYYWSTMEDDFVAQAIVNAETQIPVPSVHPSFKVIAQRARKKYRTEFDEIVKLKEITFNCDICSVIEVDLTCESIDEEETKYHPSTDES